MLLVPPTVSSLPEWARKVAVSVNYLLGRQGFPFGEPATSAPAEPTVGQAWIDASDDNRVKIWDGSIWQPLW
jgi:hypothetical protein